MEPSIYPDSSFLVSLVCKDANSAAASACMERTAEPLFFTSLHRIEIRNAIRNAEARGFIAKNDLRAAFRQIDEDLRDGLLVYTPADWTEALRRADELSETHTAKDGQRTIDLLHVSMALECGATTFLSFDNRQRRLAKAAGLKVKP